MRNLDFQQFSSMMMLFRISMITQKKCVENRDFEALEMYVMELLMGIR